MPDQTRGAEPVTGQREARPKAPSIAAHEKSAAEASLIMPAAIAESLIEGAIAMTQTVTAPAQAVERIKSAAGDLNTRSRVAFGEAAKLAEEMTDLARGNAEAIAASGRVAVDGAEALGREAAIFGAKGLATTAAAFTSLTTVKSPAELFALHGNYLRASFTEIMTEAIRIGEICMNLPVEVVRPFSSRVAVAAEKVRTAAT